MTLGGGQTEAHHAAAVHLRLQPVRMQHGAAIGDAEIFLDLECAGFGVQFDHAEAGDQRRHQPALRQLVLGNADQAGACQRRHRRLGERVDVGRHFLAGKLAAEFDRLLGGVGEAHRLGRVGLVDDLFVLQVVVIRDATQFNGGDLEQLVLGIHRRHVVGPRGGVGRVRTGLDDRPRQMVVGSATDDDDIVPIVTQHFGGDA